MTKSELEQKGRQYNDKKKSIDSAGNFTKAKLSTSSDAFGVKNIKANWETTGGTNQTGALDKIVSKYDENFEKLATVLETYKSSTLRVNTYELESDSE